MQRSDFPLTIDDVIKIVYHFAEETQTQRKLNNHSKKAGYVWLQ